MGKRKGNHCLAFDKEEFLKQHKKVLLKKKRLINFATFKLRTVFSKRYTENEIEALKREEAIYTIIKRLSSS